MVDRESVIARIRKLSAMTTANGCSEAEAAFAATKLRELTAEWDIQQDELSLKADAAGMIEDIFNEIIHGEPSVSGLLTPMSRLFTVRMYKWRNKRLGLGLPLTFCEIHIFGYPADVAAAKALCEIITMAVQTEVTAYLATQQFKGRGGAKAKRHAEHSFRVGMNKRLGERILAMVQQPIAASGNALVVLKAELVNQEFDKLGVSLSQSRGLNAYDSGAFHAGAAAGARVDLGSAKLGSTLRIGRSQ